MNSDVLMYDMDGKDNGAKQLPISDINTSEIITSHFPHHRFTPTYFKKGLEWYSVFCDTS
jgi:hypothetical protein